MKTSSQACWRKAAHPVETAFTLLELLVVIAIIGVLVSLLVPSLSQMKVRAYDTQCLGNFKQLGIVHKVFLDDTGRFPPRGVVEINPSTQRPKGKSLFQTLGGVNPAPFPYNDQYSQATNRPFYRYQGNPLIFRCPMDKGHFGDLDWPHHLTHHDKSSAWETAGSSYLYNIALGAPRDSTRNPPLPLGTLLPRRGSIASQLESWVEKPERYILMNEPPALSLNKVLTRDGRVWTNFWTQWHRNRGRIDFGDPRIAPSLFISPVLFVDGHAAMHDFTQSLTRDPYYPYEETKDWIWYQPRP